MDFSAASTRLILSLHLITRTPTLFHSYPSGGAEFVDGPGKKEEGIDAESAKDGAAKTNAAKSSKSTANRLESDELEEASGFVANAGKAGKKMVG